MLAEAGAQKKVTRKIGKSDNKQIFAMPVGKDNLKK